MTILVTGSAGHLGEALMRRLRAEHRPARGVDIKPSPFTDCVGSIGDRDFINACMPGVRTVIHAASVHKPHVATHSKRDFVGINVLGTLALLEEAVASGVEAFIFTSTTSAFGAALTPAAGEPAIWVTEEVAPIPRNVYGVTKVAAEGLCQLFFREHRLPVIVLRTSRFFPEADDDDAISASYEIANVQANELLYRRVDIGDVVSAHLLAVEKARNIGFARYVISAATPFGRDDLASSTAMLRKLSIGCFRNAWSFIARAGGVSSHALTGSTSVTGRWRSSLGDRNTITATRCTVFGPEPTFAAHWRVRLAARVMGPDCAGARRRYSVFLRPLGAERRSTRGAHQIVAVVRLRESCR